MTPPTLVELSDTKDQPKVLMMLPVPLRMGDRIQLAFQLKRQTGQRNEVLDVKGCFRVTSVVFSEGRQVLAVESCGVSAAWRAVKRSLGQPRRSLGPCRFPRTSI